MDTERTDKPMRLWPDGADGGPPTDDAPTLTPLLLADRSVRGLVLVLPGGGYANLAPHEGRPIAEHFNQWGLHAAVLHYRRAPHRHPTPLHDAQRAIRLIRHHAKDWGIDDVRIAVLGFSAGGHLASTAAVHFDRFTSDDDDLAAAVSARPDAAVLCYPVIDLTGEHTHKGSRMNLLGRDFDPAVAEQLSSHLQVSDRTPPAFLWHTLEDGAVPAENAIAFASACQRHGVPFELHVYEKGGHGLGLPADDAHGVSTWGELAARFCLRHLCRE